LSPSSASTTNVSLSSKRSVCFLLLFVILSASSLSCFHSVVLLFLYLPFQSEQPSSPTFCCALSSCFSSPLCFETCFILCMCGISSMYQGIGYFPLADIFARLCLRNLDYFVWLLLRFCCRKTSLPHLRTSAFPYFRLSSAFLCFTTLSTVGCILSDSHFHPGRALSNDQLLHQLARRL